MINLGNKIRELRVNKGLTQEQLASSLNVSPQAVSKWETGAGYPDVATLPVLAGYFGVSLDVMFEYDPEEVQEKIQKILLASRNYGLSAEGREKTLLDGITAYPGAVILKRELLETYAYRILNHDCPDLKEKALALGNRLITESNDYIIVSGVKNDMAMIHAKFEEYDEAKKIIDSMPYLFHLDIFDRMRCSAMWLKGEDQLKAARTWKVWAHQELFMVCDSEGMGFWEMEDYENALLSFEEKVNVIEVFRHRKVPEEYNLLGGTLQQATATVRIAACLYRLGRLEECDKALERAYNLLHDDVSDNLWTKHSAFYLDCLKEKYDEMGLSEYKACPY